MVNDTLDLDGRHPPFLPSRNQRQVVISTKLPAHLAAWLRERARLDRTTPADYVRTLIVHARDGAMPADCRDWLVRQAAQCGIPGRPDDALVAVIRHLADRWPNGARLRDSAHRTP
jgi:hypothetical protein